MTAATSGNRSESKSIQIWFRPIDSTARAGSSIFSRSIVLCFPSLLLSLSVFPGLSFSSNGAPPGLPLGSAFPLSALVRGTEARGRGTSVWSSSCCCRRQQQQQFGRRHRRPRRSAAGQSIFLFLSNSFYHPPEAFLRSWKTLSRSRIGIEKLREDGKTKERGANQTAKKKNSTSTSTSLT